MSVIDRCLFFLSCDLEVRRRTAGLLCFAKVYRLSNPVLACEKPIKKLVPFLLSKCLVESFPDLRYVCSVDVSTNLGKEGAKRRL